MKIKNQNQFERLVSEAAEQDFSGWDFSYLNCRWHEQPVSWDYKEIVFQKSRIVSSLLDTGTGGGEFLSGLTPFPALTCATESYTPNVQIAGDRLEPLGCKVAYVKSTDNMPFEDNQFELIINRHESVSADEFYRVLKPGGIFLTQQVGGQHNLQLNELLSEKENSFTDWSLSSAADKLLKAGFSIITQKEEFPVITFDDIGAVIYYLKAVPWQIVDFTVEKYYDQLVGLHNLIEEQGKIIVKGHYFFIEAQK